MRTIQPQREEERLLLLLREKISRESRDLTVVRLLFLDLNTTPVPVPDVESVEVLPSMHRQIRDLHSRLRKALIPRRILLKTTPSSMPSRKASLRPAVIGVEDFACGDSRKTLCFEMLRQRRFASDLHAAPPVLLIAKHPAR